jgi:hypothetical protein
VVDPVLAALAMLAEGLAVELALGLAERQWKRGRPRELTPARVARLTKESFGDVEEALRREFGGAPEHDCQAAVVAARESLAAVSPIVVTDALALDLRPERLAEHVSDKAADIRRAAMLDDTCDALYDRIVLATCQAILRAVSRLPGFSDQLQIATYQRVGDMREMQQKVVEHIAGEQARDAADARDFEHRYLDLVAWGLDRIELFGVSRGRAAPAVPSDTAYVNLAVARSGGARLPDDDEDLTGAGVDIASALDDQRLVLLRGGAGAGKTTLLRRLAVSAARQARDEGGTGRGAVPFFVPLRDYAQKGLPATEALIENVASAIAAEMPSGWVSARLRERTTLLLVDALDELDPARRVEARDWLERLVASYENLRCVVSARPFAVPEDWLAAAGFVTYDLQPLSSAGRDEFLAAWHDAARELHDSDPAVQEWLDECQRGLAEQLKSREELRRLAGNPLLCGLLCALYQDRNMHLPRDRKGLYDAALELLLVRWDEERGVRVDALPWLTREEQTVLLQRFAYSMVRNAEFAVSREDATLRFAHAMRGLRSQDARPEPILQRTLERTGLLREPSPDVIQFVHRTFRDYLAAKEVVECGDLDFLVEQSHLDQWHDVVINAVAHARPRERERVLRRLVAGNTAARADQRIHNRLHLVAAACLEQADVLATDEAREMVEQAAARLIPPATLDDAELLARAGRFVLELLPGPEGLTAQEAACVVRTVARVGGEGIRERLAAFVPVAESLVIDELLRAWRLSEDPETYARTVLADVDFGDRSLEVRGWHRVCCLPHLRRLTSVVCYGDFALLRPLAEVPRLRRLELVRNDLVRDLSPLAASRSLRSLHLTSGCDFLRDLSPLAKTTVEELGLHLVAARVDTLRHGALRRLVVRDSRLRDGLGPLPPDLGLRELFLDNPPRSRNLRGIERSQQLEHVSVWGVPQPEEIEALARLPNLTRLTLRNPDPADAGLRLLGTLPALRRLDLDDVPWGQQDALLAAVHVPPSVEICINGVLVRPASP